MIKVHHIVIEGHDGAQMDTLFEQIQNQYNLFDNCVIERDKPVSETIIDHCRWKETGKISVERPPKIEDCHCEDMNGKCEGDDE